MAKPSSRITFNAKISRGSKLHYKINVFKRLCDMREYASKVGGGGKAFFSKAYGACTYYHYDRMEAPETDEVGEISLWEGALGGEIVSHECVHAALGALDRKNIKTLTTGDIGSDHAEELCYISGYLVKQIYNKLYKLKIID